MPMAIDRCVVPLAVRSLAALCLALVLAVPGAAQTTAGDAAAAAEVAEQRDRHFVRRVWPILEEKCLACHGGKPDDIKGEFRVDSREQILRGGESEAAAIHVGDPDGSPLIRAVRWQDLEMPPKENDRLTARQIADLAQWIADGAAWPDDAARQRLLREGNWNEQEDGEVRLQLSEGLSAAWSNRGYQAENLWAYRPLPPAAPPTTPAGEAPERHPIDAFVAARLEHAGLAPAPLADRRSLLRRATFDLLGLPPQPDEVRAFLDDPAPDAEAFAKVVERLLASPHYGERWARHWLDVVRYADSSGLANDYERPHAWRYRDWVIRAFNNDKPYREFVGEQLAGDEIDPSDPGMLVATGFLRMGPWELTGMEVARVARQRFLDDVTDIVGQAFLSHPLQCAKCHDHKFDPLPTRDYYRLQAVFQTTQFAEREAPFLDQENVGGFEERKYLLQRRDTLQAMLQEIQNKNRAAEEAWYAERGRPWRDRNKALRQGVPEDQIAPRHLGLDSRDLGLERVARKGLERLAWRLDRYEPYAMSVYDGASPELTRVHAPLRMPADPLQGVVETGAILVGGDPFSRGQEVAPGVLSLLAAFRDSDAAPVSKVTSELAGRRSDLAAWITRPENSLAWRSIANRVWAWHFGQGLAGNPNNFGAMGRKPSHPELLDYLAGEFLRQGGSFKALHRLIMTSETYRRSSRHPQPQQLSERDPDGQLYAVFPPRRLSAEEIRDAMLAASGELNPALGGVPVRPEMHLETAFQPRQVMGTFADAWQPSPSPRQRHRRTIYALQLRGLRDPWMETFDQPTPDLSCELREASTVAPQALSLINNEQVHHRALAMAHRVLSAAESDEEALERAFWLAFSRPPGDEERRDCLEHWRRMTEARSQAPPPPQPPPSSILRDAVEENTGERFRYEEPLEFYADFVPDLHPSEVDARTRGLADVCLVLLNSNEFLYLD